jgi:hypothetical protein
MEMFRDRRKLRKKLTRTGSTNASSTISTTNTQHDTITDNSVGATATPTTTDSFHQDDLYHQPTTISSTTTTLDGEKEGKPNQVVASSLNSHATSSCPPPPGFSTATPNTTSSSTPTVTTNKSSLLVTPPPPPGFDGAVDKNEADKDDLTQQIPSISTGLSPKYICYVPPSTVSTAATTAVGITLPKQLAKLFLELYYPIFAGSGTTIAPAVESSTPDRERDGQQLQQQQQQTLQIASLLPYYTPTFQKSTSINGIHSVVSGDIFALVQQMQYVIATIPGGLHIQSVVAQDLMEGGVLIMIAGTANIITPTDSTAIKSSSSFFSHTVTLIPMRSIPIVPSTISTAEDKLIETTQMILGYQIHNDAFMLLS